MNVFRLKDSNYANQKFNGSALLLIPLVLVCFAISPMAQAVVPAPDGGYAGGNTAEGQNALFSLTTGGVNNTAIGGNALVGNTIGNSNTANGFNALSSNDAGELNTAVGTQALFNNTAGGQNTAVGTQALFNNTTAGQNTAIGSGALFNN